MFFGVLSVVCTLVQDAVAAEPRVLGLEQLIQMALERSPELKMADQDIAAALSDLQQAKAAQWAQLDVTGVGGIVNDTKEPLVVVSPTPGPDGLLRGHLEKDETDGLGPFGKLEFTISQPLYTFGKIAHRKHAASDAVAVQQAARERTRGGVILKVKELYYALILAQQGKSTASDISTFVDDARTRITRLLQLGSTNVDESDLYRLEAYAAEAKRFRSKAGSGTNVTYFALKQLIGLPPHQEFVLDVKELPKDTRALGEQQDYIAQALRLRPEFEQLDKGVEARRNMVEAAKADLYPSIFATAVGSFAGAPGREDVNVPYLSDDFHKSSVGVVLGTKWHFDLGILQGKVSKAHAEYQRLRQAREAATLNIPIEVAKYYQEAVEHLQAAQASELAASASRKWIVVAFANFDIGVGTAKDIFVAIERYGKNRGDYLSSFLQYHLALAHLSHAIGEYRAQSQ
jgi:outer membrane protein TolC